MNKWLLIHPTVRQAIDAGKAVVALESTIISHGMPYPQNVQTATDVEQIVRDHGAVPATIALLDGKICVGLTCDQLTRVGREKTVSKVSWRDLPIVLARGQCGATTVAATMICAQLAGISVFVTGGIGGVHRAGHETMDVSADLMQLATTSVAVVCAGAKAILDLPRTLEVLETNGVPVIGYQTDEFPAFYSRTSGLKVDARVDDVKTIASIMKTKWELGLTGSVLVTVPVPKNDEMPRDEVDELITQALNEATDQQIKGKDITPFLLAAMVEKTAGKSLQTNISLVKNNARVGAQLAVAFAEMSSK